VSRSKATEKKFNELLEEIKVERREKVKEWLKEKNIGFIE